MDKANIPASSPDEEYLLRIGRYYDRMSFGEQKIADFMGRNLMLLPSSTHEFLVVNKNCEIGLEKALEMVSEINRTEVPSEDFLADSVYIFEKDTGRIKVFSKVEVVAA